MLCFIFMLTQESYLQVCLKMFAGRFDSGWKIHCKCGWRHPWSSNRGLNKIEGRKSQLSTITGPPYFLSAETAWRWTHLTLPHHASQPGRAAPSTLTKTNSSLNCFSQVFQDSKEVPYKTFVIKTKISLIGLRVIACKNISESEKDTTYQ